MIFSFGRRGIGLDNMASFPGTLSLSCCEVCVPFAVLMPVLSSILKLTTY